MATQVVERPKARPALRFRLLEAPAFPGRDRYGPWPTSAETAFLVGSSLASWAGLGLGLALYGAPMLMTPSSSYSDIQTYGLIVAGLGIVGVCLTAIARRHVLPRLLQGLVLVVQGLLFSLLAVLDLFAVFFLLTYLLAAAAVAAEPDNQASLRTVLVYTDLFLG